MWEEHAVIASGVCLSFLKVLCEASGGAASNEILEAVIWVVIDGRQNCARCRDL